MEKNRPLGDACPRFMKNFLIAGWLIGASFLSGCATLRQSPLLQGPLLSAEEYTSLGNAYMAKGEKDLAVKQFEAAVKQNKKHVPAWIALGNIAYSEKRWEDARAFYSKALKAKKGDPATVNNLAMVDLAEGKNLDQAVKHVEDVLPNAAPALRPYLLDTLINLAILQGRLQDAQTILTQAEKEAPADDAEFQKNLAASREKLTQAKSK
jgi:Flp pilus assembly protein TadD